MEADIMTNARRLLGLFEGQLRAYPGQWAVLEPIWKRDGAQPRGARAVE
jgi:lauroyl/myristoyl acyltransferase